MAEELSADLVLDISPALSSVEELGSAIDSALLTSVDSFSTQMDAAVASVPPVELEPDVTAVEPAISDAVASADTTIEPDVSDVAPAITDAISSADTTTDITADASTVTPDIDAAIASADGLVPIDADASAVTGEIDAAVAGADAVVPVDANTDSAVSLLEAFISQAEAAAPTVEVDADTTQAVGALDELSTSADGVASSTSAASGGVHDAEGSIAALGGAAALATGEAGGLKDVAEGVGIGGTTAALGVGALTASVGEFFHEGVQAVGAGQRFDTVLGDMADKVETVKVGDLTADVSKLGVEFGSTDAEMQNAISSVYQFGINGGKSKEESANFAQTLVGLAARAVSLNPALGNISDVVENMSLRLARGGRFAANYQVSLSSAEISARALAESGKQSASDLTIQEKSFAAAEIAAERYGNGLSSTVANGAQNAANVQKSLIATIKEVIEDFGAPLVVPMFDVIKAGVPIVEALGSILSELATSALPVVASAAEIVAPPLQVIADVMHVLEPAITPVIAGFLAFQAIEVLPAIFTAVASALFAVSNVAPIAAAGIESAAVASDAAAIGIAGALGPIGIIVGGLALGAAAFGLFSSGADDSESSISALTKTLTDAGAVIDDTAAKALRSQLQNNNQIDDLRKAGVSWGEYTKAVESAGHASGDTANRAQELLDALNTDSPAAFDEHMHNADKTLGEFTASTDTGKVSNQAFVDVLRSVSPAAGAMAEQLVRSGQANDGLKRTILDQIIAQQAAGTATRDLNAIGADNADITKKQTDATQQLATSALPALKAGQEQATQAHQAGVVALTDGTAALARYEAGTMSLSDTETALKAAQDSMAGAVLAGDFAYASSTASALANKAALDETAQSLITAITPLAGVTEGTRAHTAELEAQATQLGNGEAAMGRYHDGTLSAKEATDALDGATSVLKGDLDLLLGRFLSSDEAMNNYQIALGKMGDELLANGESFDQNTQAGAENRNTLDGVAEKAITAAEAMSNNGKSAAEAVGPLNSFRGALQTIRDNLANAGQDTTFIDSLLGQVDGAIAGINAKAPDMNAAGAGLGANTNAGIRTQVPDSGAAGSELGAASFYGASSHVGDHGTAGTDSGSAYAGGVRGETGDGAGAGSELGAASYYGASSHVGDHGAAGGDAGGAYSGGVRSQGGNSVGAGSEIGAASYYGAASHTGDHAGAGSSAGASYVGGVGSQQGAAEGAGSGLGGAAVRGASGGDLSGLGASLGAGFAAGISGATSAVLSAAQSLAATAMNAVHDWIGNPPYPSREGMKLGKSLGYGFAVGISDQEDVAAAHATGVASAATAAMQDGYSDFRPAVGPDGGGRAGMMAGTTITFDIDVHGVTDPSAARAIGEQVGAGAADALVRRGVVTVARLG